MGTTTPAEGIEIRGNSLRISFQYKNTRCRETLKLPPTKTNIQTARRWRETILREIELGTFDYAAHFPDSPYAARFSLPTGTITIAELFKRWWPSKLTLRASTQESYQRVYLRSIAPQLGSMRLMDLRLETLQAWQSTLALQVSAHAANYARALLIDMINFAMHNGIIAVNPARALRSLRRSAEEVDPFTDEELAAVLPYVPEDLQPIVIFELATGLRLGELFALRWEDVDTPGQRVYVHRTRSHKQGETGTKTHKNRYVDLSVDAQAALLRQKSQTFADGDFIFRVPWTRQPFREVSFLRFWKRSLQRAGVRYRRPYMLRHTCASRWLAQGVPPTYVAKQLGHNLQTLFKFYARWCAEQKPTLPRLGQNWDNASSNPE